VKFGLEKGWYGVSFLTAAPEALATAASDLAGIGSTISTANAAAAAPTTGLLAAAEDEVSTQIAALFAQHAHGYQQLSTQVAAFHEEFVQALTSSAGAYVSAEANAARTLIGGAVSRVESLGGGAVSRVASLGGVPALFGGQGAIASHLLTSPLSLRPTGGLSGLLSGSATAALRGPLSSLTNGAAAPVALAGNSIATAIENAYNAIEPYVQYAFNLLSYVVGFVPLVGILAPQINFLYNLIEPIVQSGLFNILDWLSGSISFGTGLSNFFAATSSSINFFIQTEINWLLSFLPPLPPFPPF
jgi:PE family